ncbi:hypothetical protein D3C87_1077830 [compost metagenome]
MAKENVIKLINLIKSMDAAAEKADWSNTTNYLTFTIGGKETTLPFTADTYYYQNDALVKLLVDEADLNMDDLAFLGSYQADKSLEDTSHLLSFEYRGQTIYNPFIINGNEVDPIDYFGKSFILSDFVTKGPDLIDKLRKTANNFCEVTLINNHTGYERFNFGEQASFEDAFERFSVLATCDIIEYHHDWHSLDDIYEELIERDLIYNLYDLLVQLTMSTKQFEDFAKVWDFGFDGFLNGKYALSLPQPARVYRPLFGFKGKAGDLLSALKEATNNGGQET